MAIGLPQGQVEVTAGTGPVATGQEYAQYLSGGVPLSAVVAPGVSFSPQAPMGSTEYQGTYMPFMSMGPVPVMPPGISAGDSYMIDDQMPYAPPGTSEPNIYDAATTAEAATATDPTTTYASYGTTAAPGTSDGYAPFMPSGPGEVYVPKEEYQQYISPQISEVFVPENIVAEDIALNTTFAPQLYSPDVRVPTKFDLDVEAFLTGVDPEDLAKVDVSNIDLPTSYPDDMADPEPRDPFLFGEFFEKKGGAG
tara:strand:- start:65 stop:820 length:756 start_codon:yes stop_codon:yes gene_type:complete